MKRADVFFDVVKARRSVRSFTDAPVPREVLEKIVSAGIEAPTGCNAQLKQYIIVDDPAVLDAIRFASPALKTARATIVLVMDPQPTKYGTFWMQDASAAMENMLLAAVALGYAACWVEGAIRRAEEELREILGVPERLRVWSLLPVGKPAEKPGRPPKPEPDEVIHVNRFAT